MQNLIDMLIRQGQRPVTSKRPALWLTMPAMLALMLSGYSQAVANTALVAKSADMRADHSQGLDLKAVAIDQDANALTAGEVLWIALMINNTVWLVSSLIGSDDENNRPTANTQTITISPNSSQTIDLNVLASDPEGDDLIFKLDSAPMNGVLNLQSNGMAEYTSAPVDAQQSQYNYCNDSFEYSVTDGSLSSASALVTIEIDPVINDLYHDDMNLDGLADELMSMWCRYEDSTAAYWQFSLKWSENQNDGTYSEQKEIFTVVPSGGLWWNYNPIQKFEFPLVLSFIKEGKILLYNYDDETDEFSSKEIVSIADGSEGIWVGTIDLNYDDNLDLLSVIKNADDTKELVWYEIEQEQASPLTTATKVIDDNFTHSNLGKLYFESTSFDDGLTLKYYEKVDENNYTPIGEYTDFV